MRTSGTTRRILAILGSCIGLAILQRISSRRGSARRGAGRLAQGAVEV